MGRARPSIAALERFALMLQRAWGAKIYTLRFSLGSTTTGTPQDDLAGRSAAPLATDSSTPEEDWAVDDPMTWYIRANAKDKADGTMDILALEGETGFDISGETAPGVHVPPRAAAQGVDG